jgi:hypothetical protein
LLKSGLLQLRLARIAEPLLSKAATTGLIGPPGNASPRPKVFIPATIA